MLEGLRRLSVSAIADGDEGLHVSVERFNDDFFADRFFECAAAFFAVEDFVEPVRETALVRVAAGVAALSRFPRRKVFDSPTSFFLFTHK